MNEERLSTLLEQLQMIAHPGFSEKEQGLLKLFAHFVVYGDTKMRSAGFEESLAAAKSTSREYRTLLATIANELESLVFDMNGVLYSPEYGTENPAAVAQGVSNIVEELFGIVATMMASDTYKVDLNNLGGSEPVRILRDFLLQLKATLDLDANQRKAE